MKSQTVPSAEYCNPPINRQTFLTTRRASVATTVRMIYLPRLSHGYSLFVNSPAVVWSSIEVATNIICTSAMVRKPLMVKSGIVHISLPSASGQRYAPGRGVPEQHYSLPLEAENDNKWPAPQSWAVSSDPNASTALNLYHEASRGRQYKHERMAYDAPTKVLQCYNPLSIPFLASSAVQCDLICHKPPTKPHNIWFVCPSPQDTV